MAYHVPVITLLYLTSRNALPKMNPYAWYCPDITYSTYSTLKLPKGRQANTYKATHSFWVFGPWNDNLSLFLLAICNFIFVIQTREQHPRRQSFSATVQTMPCYAISLFHIETWYYQVLLARFDVVGVSLPAGLWVMPLVRLRLSLLGVPETGGSFISSFILSTFLSESLSELPLLLLLPDKWKYINNINSSVNNRSVLVKQHWY